MDASPDIFEAIFGKLELSGSGTVSPPEVCTCGTKKVWSLESPDRQVLYCPSCEER